LRVLLDTQALLWWLADDPALTRTAAKIIADTRKTVVVSAASAWEIAIKVRLGKLSTASSLMSDFCSQMEREGFDLLAISAEHGIRGGPLAWASPGSFRPYADRTVSGGEYSRDY
jgi:PIN domain nuclease of toxin-antitoxin system